MKDILTWSRKFLILCPLVSLFEYMFQWTQLTRNIRELLMSIRLLTGKSSSSGGCFSWRKHRLKQRQISSFCLAKQAPQGGKYPSWWFSLVPDTYIQKTKKLYIDSRARRNLGSINTELQDVQRIMVANIEEVLQRGEALSGTRGGCCLAYAYPQSVTWVEHIRWKVFLIPRSP